MIYEELKLSSQLCFPVYAASRLITREYQPYLDKLGITYPQYLVLMVLWEQKKLTVNDIAKQIVLHTNTVTPLLKRMESLGLLKRKRSSGDARIVVISLTAKGMKLMDEAVKLPRILAEKLTEGPFNIKKLTDLKEQLTALVEFLSGNN